MEEKIPFEATALFDFFPKDSVDKSSPKLQLTFRKGEVLKVTQRINQDWVKATSETGEIGIVPVKFIRAKSEKAVGSKKSPKSEFHVVKAKESSSLSTADSGISATTITTTSTAIIAPATTTVSAVDFKTSATPHESELYEKNLARNQSDEYLSQAIALFDFLPRNTVDISSPTWQLGFRKGESLNVIRKINAEWAKAINTTGETGIVPINFIKLKLNETTKGDGLEVEIMPVKKRQNSLSEKNSMKRWQIVSEIVSTERTYVQGLRIIGQIFLPTSLKLNQKHGFATEMELRSIFSNVTDLLSINENILAQISERCSESPEEQRCIGDIFVETATLLQSYKIYCSSFDICCTKLDHLCKKSQIFHNHLQRIQQSRKCNGLPLRAFLLTPVQRIPRYILFLQDYIKVLEIDHPDYLLAKKALKQMQTVALDINNSVPSEIVNKKNLQPCPQQKREKRSSWMID